MRNIGYIEEIPVDLSSNDEIFALTNDWLVNRRCSRHIITLNALMLVAAIRYYPLKKIMQHADLITVDGYGIARALQKKGYQNIQRLTGVGLTRQLLKKSCQNGYSVYFLGGTPQTAAMMEKILPVQWPGLMISDIRDGYDDNLNPATVCKEIRLRQPHILLVGLGAPKQELFLAQILPCLAGTVGVGVGGTFEILCGLKREAPAFISNYGWEWCFRMLQQPCKLKRLPDLARFWFRYLR